MGRHKRMSTFICQSSEDTCADRNPLRSADCGWCWGVISEYVGAEEQWTTCGGFEGRFLAVVVRRPLFCGCRVDGSKTLPEQGRCRVVVALAMCLTFNRCTAQMSRWRVCACCRGQSLGPWFAINVCGCVTCSVWLVRMSRLEVGIWGATRG